MSKDITLNNGETTTVSDHRFSFLNQFTWGEMKDRNGNSYVVSTKGILMHRLITNAPEGMEVDHKDGDGLNNQDDNLRVCTKSQNMANTGVRKDNVSGYKGVSFDRNSSKWRAELQKNNKRVFSKCFSSPLDAAIAYDEAAKEHFGEFAFINFPEKGEAK